MSMFMYLLLSSHKNNVQDEHLLRHVVKNNLLKPIIDAFCKNGNKYNMLHSGVLELLEYIRRVLTFVFVWVIVVIIVLDLTLKTLLLN